MPRFGDKPLLRPPRSRPIRLTIGIEGQSTRVLDAGDLAAFPTVEQESDFHCVTTWTYRGLRWRGVRLREVITELLGSDPPGFARAEGRDRVGAVFTTDDLLAPDVLLATHLNDEPLDRRHGAPLRLVTPGQYGYKNVKHLESVLFMDGQPGSTYGPKEHLRGRVALEERHSTRPNWWVRLPYRLSIVPVSLIAERTLRTSHEDNSSTG